MNSLCTKILLLALVAGVCIQGVAGTITGNVSYTGSATGSILVAAFTDLTLRSEPVKYDVLNSPGSYNLADLADGTYYLISFMTLNPSNIQRTDPWGYYGNPGPLTGIVISGNNNVSGADISLMDGTEQNPNPFHRDYVSPTATVQLSATVLAGVEPAIAYDGTSVYLYKHDSVGADAAMIYTINPATGAVTGSHALGLHSDANGISWLDAMVFAGSTLWVTGGYGDPSGIGYKSGVFQANLANSTSSHQIPLGDNLNLRAKIAYDGASIYVAVDSGNVHGIVKLDPLHATAVTASFLFTLPLAPEGLGYAEGYLWVGSDSLRKIDPLTGDVVASYGIPPWAAGVYFNSMFWGYDETDNTLDGYALATTGVGGEKLEPNGYRLSQNYPNPFNPTTVIQYALAARARVIVTLYNSLGQRVATLVDAEQESGDHTVRFDGSAFSSGVYFYHIQAGGFTQTRRMVLLK